MSFQYGTVRRKDAADKQEVDRQRRRGELVARSRGIYLPAEDRGDEARWLAHLEAEIARAGRGAGAGQRAAARLHAWDGIEDRHVEVIAPMSSVSRRPVVTRSRTLRPDDITSVNGLPVTTAERTLLDLGSRVTADDLEAALESALRGPSPERPDQWDEALLAALTARLADGTRGTGVRAARWVLQRRRPGALPTGSYAETRAMQWLRDAGFIATTQARIQVNTDRSRHTFWGDLADLDRGLVVEIDGLEAHRSVASQDRDHRRQNIITEALTVLRFSATNVLHDPAEMTRAVMRRRAHLPLLSTHRTVGGFDVERTDVGWVLTRRN